jgi:hypothetical protein
VPRQGLGPARLAPRGFSPPYDTSYRGVKLSPGFCRSWALSSCGARPICRRRACFAKTFRRRPDPWGPSPLPMFARHEYRARARNKWAVRGAARRWCRKLQHHVTAGYSESSSAGLPVRHLVGEFVRVGQAVAHRLGTDRLRRECPSTVCPPDRRATNPATAISILFIGPPRNELIVGPPGGSVIPLGL